MACNGFSASSDYIVCLVTEKMKRKRLSSEILSFSLWRFSEMEKRKHMAPNSCSLTYQMHGWS